MPATASLRRSCTTTRFRTTDPSSEFGAYDVPAATSDLSIVTGNYTFTPASGVGIGVENDNAFGEDWIFLFAEDYAGAARSRSE